MALENRIYRVRIEAYDPDTDTSEVLLSEEEDEGYKSLVFLGDEIPGGTLRSIAMNVNAMELGAMFSTEPLLKDAAMVTMMMGVVMGGGSECLQ